MDDVEYENDCEKQEVNEKDCENHVNIFLQNIPNDLFFALFIYCVHIHNFLKFHNKLFRDTRFCVEKSYVKSCSFAN